MRNLFAFYMAITLWVGCSQTYAQDLDFGDAPDPNYPTLLASNGASHVITPGILMGIMIDGEPNGQPNANATGDDLNQLNDEDGVVFNTALNPGQAAIVTINSSIANIFLQGWIDFNADGDWADPGEQFISNLFTIAGNNIVNFNVPPGATLGQTFARFRLSTMPGLSFIGTAPNGEVEDYHVTIIQLQQLDFGDAKDPMYPTLLVSNGARHLINPLVSLGSQIDAEPDGLPSIGAIGDDMNNQDDEDGVTFTSTIIPGLTAKVSVKASTAGFLHAWIDYNQNGSWGDAGENIFSNVALSPGINNLTFTLAGTAPLGNTYARFRFVSASTPGLSYTGPAPDGEVEDYYIAVISPTGDRRADPDPLGTLVQNEISLSVIPATSQGVPIVILAAYNDHPYPGGPGLGVAYSTDGGTMWNLKHMSYPLNPYAGIPFIDAFDPTTVADGNNNLYVGHISTDYNWAVGPASGLFVHKSANNGLTWTGPYSVATDPSATANPDPNYRLNDRCQMAVDLSSTSNYYNRLYMVWIKDRGWNMSQPLGDIYFSYSSNGGLTWSAAVILNQNQNNMGNMPVAAVGLDGTIYVCWIDYNVLTGGTGKLYLDKSTDGGTTWQSTDQLIKSINLPPISLGDGTRAKGAAVIKTSPLNSAVLYITFAEDPDGPGPDNGDIFFIRSTDSGATWSTPLRVNDDITTNDQVMPWMDVKPNGTIDIAWYDRRNDQVNLNWDVYFSPSTTGGTSFATNSKINDNAFATPSTPSGKWMGEYLGLKTDASYAYIGFTSSFFDINGDILFDKIQNPEMPLDDFGDAPDSYQTLLASNGARHPILQGVFMGAMVDAEPDGQPSANADGDDLNPPVADDEDGVVFNTALNPGSPATVTVMTSVANFWLQGWVDFNADGDWGEAGEQIINNLTTVIGPNAVIFPVPAGAAIGGTYARFRLSTMPQLASFGPAPNGEVEDYHVIIEESLDFGDAPDQPYPTLLVNNGARHINTGLKLGLLIDIEPNGQPNAMATGDDLAGTDDEDGVWWGCNFVPGQANTVQVTASGPGFLNAWFDFNKNGSWADPGEQIFTNTALVAGVNFLTINVPPNAIVGNTFARFRFSTQQGLSFTGLANDGEVEDYQFVIEDPPQMDYGDAPDANYKTLAASDGVRHALVQGPAPVFLGNLIDWEFNGQPNATATGDNINNLNDEDGVVFNTLLVPGIAASITVTASIGNCPLQAWFDFNADGDWTDPGEQVFTNLILNAGAQVLNFNIPANATLGNTYARFRFSTMGNLAYYGCAPNGEVEDYQVVIEEPLDFGDAQDPTYPTLLLSNGARHDINPLIKMGNILDAEINGQPNGNATGDDINPPAADDEDGVIIPILNPGMPATISVNSSVAGAYLQGWIDFNKDGDWADVGEQVMINQLTVVGNNTKTFIVPAGAATGLTFARFRLSTVQQLSYTGYAPDGEVEDYQVMIESYPLDYGDAMDQPYPTLLINNGARHINTGLRLGALIDVELNGQPNATATGDDLANLADEDGVWWPCNFVPGHGNFFIVTASGPGFLNAWVDWNKNGSWADAGDQIFTNVALVAGANQLPVLVPQNAGFGNTLARFRFSTQPSLSFTGLANDGEVEDYLFVVSEPVLMDYGDAPDPTYPTLAASNGARHFQGPPQGIFLGNLIDYEINGQPNAAASGDNFNNLPDEDGVIFNTPLIPGVPAVITVSASVGGILFFQGWIDFNDDGDWADAGEQIFTNTNLVAGPQPLNFNVPANAALGNTYARFRYSTVPNLNYFGCAPNGEVEDYRVLIIEDTLFIQNLTIASGTDTCFEAEVKIIVAGGGTSFTVQNGGKATMEARQSIVYLPTTRVYSGGYMHGMIKPTGMLCNPPSGMGPANPIMTEQESLPENTLLQKGFFKVYPNPTTGKLTIALTNTQELVSALIEVYSMMGEKIYHEEFNSQGTHEISLSLQPPGVYILRLINGKEAGTVKIIKQ